MPITIVQAAEFAANPKKYLSEARREKVVIVGAGCLFELYRMSREDEAELIKAGLSAMIAAGDLSVELDAVEDGISVEDLLRGRAT